jgi:hypothetical protein
MISTTNFIFLPEDSPQKNNNTPLRRENLNQPNTAVSSPESADAF